MIKFIKQTTLSRLFLILSFGVLILQLLQIVYFQRENFTNTYDVSYWKDRVEHSRYMLPLSNRGIGDNDFYAYGGYKIYDGEDPTKTVYDKPAFGISIVGFFTYYLKNPAFSGLFFGIGSIVLTFFIVLNITKSSILAAVTSAFLLLDPLFSSNLSTSLLDLPQLFLLLLNILLLVLLKEKKKYSILFIFTSGLALGLFAQVKIPVVFPIIFLMEIVWLFRSFGKLGPAIFIAGNIISMFVGYIPYAIHGYSFIEFLKIQKFVIAFYKDSNLPLHPEAIWQFLFTGVFPGVADRIPSRVAEWSYIYPLAALLGIFGAIKSLLKNNEQYIIKMLAVVVITSLLIFTVIPAFPRYVILIMPFLYFFAVRSVLRDRLNNSYIFIIVSLLVYSLINTFYYFHQSPSSSLKYFYKNFTHQYFQDIYQEQLDSSIKSKYTREEFNNTAVKLFADGEIRNLEIVEGKYQYSPFDQRVLVPIEIKYKTSFLGGFSEKKNIELIKENGKWKVKWQWGYLLNGLEEKDRVSSTRIVGKRGKIIDKNGIILAEDTDGFLISINPDLMDKKKEQELLKVLSKISRLPEIHIQNAYLENSPPNTYIKLFTTFEPLSPNVVDQLRMSKGITYEASPSRIYTNLDQETITNTYFKECCTRIYSSYNYHGNPIKSSAELVHDKKLSGYDGGSLSIIDKNGDKKRVILEKNMKNGQDLTLSE